MERVIFWNNKGGTGKTTLTFQIINEYAFQNPEKENISYRCLSLSKFI